MKNNKMRKKTESCLIDTLVTTSESGKRQSNMDSFLAWWSIRFQRPTNRN